TADDGLNRLPKVEIGQLDSGLTGITNEWAVPQKLDYTMDILGKITTLNRKKSGTSANTTYTYNSQNELTTIQTDGEAERFWVNDDFADNDKVNWSTADLNTSGADGIWSAGGGNLSCTADCTPSSPSSGVPDSGT